MKFASGEDWLRICCEGFQLVAARLEERTTKVRQAYDTARSRRATCSLDMPVRTTRLLCLVGTTTNPGLHRTRECIYSTARCAEQRVASSSTCATVFLISRGWHSAAWSAAACRLLHLEASLPGQRKRKTPREPGARPAPTTPRTNLHRTSGRASRQQCPRPRGLLARRLPQRRSPARVDLSSHSESESSPRPRLRRCRPSSSCARARPRRGPSAGARAVHDVHSAAPEE